MISCNTFGQFSMPTLSNRGTLYTLETQLHGTLTQSGQDLRVLGLVDLFHEKLLSQQNKNVKDKVQLLFQRNQIGHLKCLPLYHKTGDIAHIILSILERCPFLQGIWTEVLVGGTLNG